MDNKEKQSANKPGASLPDLKYTKGDMWWYCAITAIASGVVGYFIGENRGDKKATRKYEEELQRREDRWRKKEKETDPEISL